MEAAETYHAESITLPLRLALFDELGAAAVRRQLAACARWSRARQGGDGGTDLWVTAQELMAGAPLWVPFELVSTDFTQPPPAGGAIFQATTNGLAAGNTWLEAILQRLRGGRARCGGNLAGRRRCRARCAGSRLETVDAAQCRRLLALFAARAWLRVWDVSSDVRLPVFVCLVQSDDDTDGVEPQLGTGCHAAREIALSRALTEAAQARVAVISGARDDLYRRI